MEYLTVKEVAELKGCSERSVQLSCQNGKTECVQEFNNKGRIKFMIPLTALPKQLQEKWYKKQRTAAGVLPESSEPEPEQSAKTGNKYGLKATKRPFESFSEAEREQIHFWIDLLEQWQAERSSRKDKTEFDKVEVSARRSEHQHFYSVPQVRSLQGRML